MSMFVQSLVRRIFFIFLSSLLIGFFTLSVNIVLAEPGDRDELSLLEDEVRDKLSQVKFSEVAEEFRALIANDLGELNKEIDQYMSVLDVLEIYENNGYSVRECVDWWRNNGGNHLRSATRRSASWSLPNIGKGASHLIAGLLCFSQMVAAGAAVEFSPDNCTMACYYKVLEAYCYDTPCLYGNRVSFERSQSAPGSSARGCAVAVVSVIGLVFFYMAVEWAIDCFINKKHYIRKPSAFDEESVNDPPFSAAPGFEEGLRN